MSMIKSLFLIDLLSIILKLLSVVEYRLCPEGVRSGVSRLPVS
jgi:hypothetical protein